LGTASPVQDGNAAAPVREERAGKGPGLGLFIVVSLSPLRGEVAPRVRGRIRWSARECGSPTGGSAPMHETNMDRLAQAWSTGRDLGGSGHR
jgi:hypothetical protein